MPRYRVTISATYDVEADSPEEAEEEAVELFEEDMHKAISCGDSPADWMGITTTELKDE